jgi:hypothetical protein
MKPVIPYMVQFGKKILWPFHGEKYIQYVHNIKSTCDNGKAAYCFLVFSFINNSHHLVLSASNKKNTKKEDFGYQTVIGDLYRILLKAGNQ